jgi:hypothetical protein
VNTESVRSIILEVGTPDMRATPDAVAFQRRRPQDIVDIHHTPRSSQESIWTNNMRNAQRTADSLDFGTRTRLGFQLGVIQSHGATQESLAIRGLAI